ncbi:MAG: HAD family phosphatase [Treponemataceae bacterium]
MKLFIFDMGGVVTGNVFCVPEMASHLGIDVTAFFRGAGSDPDVSHTSPYNLGDLAEIMKGTITPATFWLRFNERTGLTVTEDLWGTFFQPVRDEGTYALIAALRKRGYRVVCGTNSLHAHYEIHRKRSEYSCFDAIYASHRMGVIKPDPAFWRLILRTESCAPQDAFFVDDHEENVLAAEALGLRVHRFVDSALLAESLHEWTGVPEARL